MGPKGEVRPPLISFLFTFMSCGLYGLYWGHKLTNEVNAFLGEERMSLLKIVGLSWLTCNAYGLYFIFVEGKEIIKEVQAKAGLPQKAPLLADIVRMQGALNAVWEQLPD